MIDRDAVFDIIDYMAAKFTKSQLGAISHFFSDLAKILFASVLVGYFIPSFSGAVGIATFVGGLLLFVAFFVFSVIIAKEI